MLLRISRKYFCVGRRDIKWTQTLLWNYYAPIIINHWSDILPNISIWRNGSDFVKWLNWITRNSLYNPLDNACNNFLMLIVVGVLSPLKMYLFVYLLQLKFLWLFMSTSLKVALKWQNKIDHKNQAEYVPWYIL